MHLREIAAVFLKLGSTAFGGPAVHIALLENEVVRRRNWLSHEEFIDLMGATNLIPGPNSTEMAIHIGLRRGGWKGLLVAGTCFIVPAFLITFACGCFYVRYAKLPELQGILYGVKPVVLAIVFQALWRLSRKALGTSLSMVIALAAFVASLLGVHELLLLLIAGAVAPLARGTYHFWKNRQSLSAAFLLPPLLPATWTTASATGGTAIGLGSIFLFFLKVGSVLYGSGYVLLAFLRADLVQRWGWLTETELLDAIAIGQVTPGPVFTTSTFIGYLLAGPAGACLATTGIFLPAFLFVAISAPLIPRIRKSKVAGAFLDGVNAASLALMAAVTIQLLGAAFVDVTTMILGIGSAVALMLLKPNPIWLILGAGCIGFFLHP